MGEREGEGNIEKTESKRASERRRKRLVKGREITI